jgi:Cft2 family RNA processing exonuclease
MSYRPLHEIAADIRKDWSAQTKDKQVPIYADAYLRPMETLTHITDNYHMDSAETVVRYFLSNAATFRGASAQALKEELREILRSVA